MKKSNIILIAFSALVIASMLGFFVWIKAHEVQIFKIESLTLGEFSVVYVDNVEQGHGYLSFVPLPSSAPN
ncbi:MAG: hypothetical protein LBS52_04455 [Dysgonamonadaceae bacterium]|jgi:hypothetical protein|nr:hypothetical protein [Dysgonamonadaceae bacterium]